MDWRSWFLSVFFQTYIYSFYSENDLVLYFEFIRKKISVIQNALHESRDAELSTYKFWEWLNERQYNYQCTKLDVMYKVPIET